MEFSHLAKIQRVPPSFFFIAINFILSPFRKVFKSLCSTEKGEK